MVRWPLMATADARTLIARAGGLHTRAGLAKRYGVSPQYMGKVTRHADFPDPIEIDEGTGRTGPVWFGDEADAYRRAHRRPLE